jgi:hypothetical protein
MYPNPHITATQGTLYPLGLAEPFEAPIPDYAVTSLIFDIPDDNFLKTFVWELIYQDGTGRVYRRVP